MAEMKAGYKQTDIGVIPEDWGALPLDHIARVRGGKRLPKGKALTDIANSHPYIRVLDMKNGSVDVSEIKYVPDDVFPEIKNYRIYASDLFISVAGTLGIIGRVPDVLNGANLTENANRICDLKINKEFLFYYLCSNKIQNHIQSMQTVGAQPKLALGRIEKFIIPTPPQESEQKAIAAALSDVDGLIKSLEKLIVKKRDMKTAAMQQLLTGKKRLPGFDGEWNKRDLGELGDCIIGLTYSPSQIDESGTLVLRSSNIQNGVLKFEDNVRVISKIPEKLMVRQNDILVCVRNGSRALIGKCALINQSAIGMTFGAFMSVYRSEFGSFIFYQFQSDVIQEQINKNLGATINQITNKTMRSFEIDFPEDENERNAIVSILSDIDSEIDTLEQRLDKARSLKTGMMHELLTGKTRLIKTDKKQEAA